MTNREKYIDFCETQVSMPLYLRPIWLSSVSKTWDVILVEDGGNIIGAMPYEIVSVHGIKQIRNFWHTKYCGIYVTPTTSFKPYKNYSTNRKVLTSIAEAIDALPIEYICLCMSPCVTNCTPLWLKGFSIEARYTYRIHYQHDFEKIWDNMHTHVRARAKNKQKLLIRKDAHGADVLLHQIAGSFEKQGMSTKLTEAFLNAVYTSLKARNQSALLTAEDNHGQIHGAACFVWDDENLYYEFAGEDPALRSSNSLTLLVLEGIRMAHEKHLNFDFDIGMTENFTDFAASFGAVSVSYCEVRKVTTKSKLKAFAIDEYFLLRGRR